MVMKGRRGKEHGGDGEQVRRLLLPFQMDKWRGRWGGDMIAREEKVNYLPFSLTG